MIKYIFLLASHQSANMKKNNLAKTGIEVSCLGLGTMTFGEQNTEEQAFAQMDCALAAGVNLFDTAEM